MAVFIIGILLFKQSPPGPLFEGAVMANAVTGGVSCLKNDTPSVCPCGQPPPSLREARLRLRIFDTPLRMTPFSMVHIKIRPLADTATVNCQFSYTSSE